MLARDCVCGWVPGWLRGSQVRKETNIEIEKGGKLIWREVMEYLNKANIKVYYIRQ